MYNYNETILCHGKLWLLLNVVLIHDTFIIKVCLTKSADLSVFVLFFFLLSYFSLPPPASLDFSVISQPISMKFGMFIVIDMLL